MTDRDDVAPRASVLREAEVLITGDRNVTYGSPTQNFTTIAKLLTSRFEHKLKPGEKITAADVADIMILVKVARNIAQPKRDNWVDIAGYAGCGYETTLEDEAPKRAQGGVTGGIFINPLTSGSVSSVDLERAIDTNRRRTGQDGTE